MDFHPKEVVWAKVKGYPWWPAYINKLPEDTDGNFKVIFFAQDTYALLQPRCVQKFADNYTQHSKTKAKKFLKALQLANNSANRIAFIPNSKNSISSKKKTQKKQSQQCIINSEEQQHEQFQQSASQKIQQSQSIIQNQQIEQLIQNQIEQIDRKKVEKIENELTEIISNLQSNWVKQWKFSKYFEQFMKQYSLNSEQILHSNLTRKIRYIIQSMKSNKLDQKQIEKLETISSELKTKVLNYLTDTSYYDQHLKIIDKSRHNKVQVEGQVVKIMKKRYNGQIKKQFINILAEQIGGQVGKNPKFKSKQFIADLKEGAYDVIKNVNSKAATLRMADQLILRYRE